MKVQTLSAVTVFVIAIVTAVVSVESRYALDKELDETTKFMKYSFTEIRLDRAEDKLNALLLIPLEKRTDYQRAEMLRLNSFILKLQRRIDQEK
jgi:hypothetical protein